MALTNKVTIRLFSKRNNPADGSMLHVGSATLEFTEEQARTQSLLQALGNRVAKGLMEVTQADLYDMRCRNVSPREAAAKEQD